MRKVIYLLSMLILFQSCYVYKSFDIEKEKVKKLARFKIELKNSKVLKGKISKVQKDTTVFINFFKTYKIHNSEILNIQKKKFSLWKTTKVAASLYLGIVIIGVGLASILEPHATVID